MEKLEPITSFKGDYDFLSNDFVCPFKYGGLEYSNVEAAFIASRSSNEGQKRKISKLSAGNARKKRNKIEEDPEWYDNRDTILYDILKAKFEQNEPLKNKLIKTSTAKLVNTVSYNDIEYGVYMGKGKNKLGKLLMELRKNLLSKE